MCERTTQNSTDNASVSSEDFYDADDTPSASCTLDSQLQRGFPSTSAECEIEEEEEEHVGSEDMGGEFCA